MGVAQELGVEVEDVLLLTEDVQAVVDGDAILDGSTQAVVELAKLEGELDAILLALGQAVLGIGGGGGRTVAERSTAVGLELAVDRLGILLIAADAEEAPEEVADSVQKTLEQAGEVEEDLQVGDVDAQERQVESEKGLLALRGGGRGSRGSRRSSRRGTTIAGR